MSSISNGLRFLFKEKSLRAEILRSSLGSIAAKASYVVLSFMLSITLARFLGAEGFGVYSYVLTIVMMVSIPTEMGLSTLVLRETSYAYAKNAWALMQGIWRWSDFVTLIVSIVMIAVLILAIAFSPVDFEEHKLHVFYIALVLVPVASLGRLRDATLRGLGKIVAGQLRESVFRPLIFIFLLFLYFILAPTKELSPVVAMGMHVFAAFFSLAISAFMLAKAQPLQLKVGVFPIYKQRAWLFSALPLAIVTGLQLIITKTDIIMLGLLRSDAEVGIYQAVIQMSLIGGVAQEILQMIISPYVSRFHALNEKGHLQKIVKLGSQGVFIITMPMLILFVFFGDKLLGMFFGEMFMIGGAALIILILGRIANASFGPVGMVLQMTGYEKETVIGVAVAAILNVVLNLLFIPIYGMEGAAVATACSLAISHAIMYRFTRLRLSIETSILPLKCVAR